MSPNTVPILLFLAVVGTLLALADVASGQNLSNVNCATAGYVQGCQVSYVEETDVTGSTRRVTFAASYRAGIYANGDVWVECPGNPATCRVTGTTPSVEYVHDPFSGGSRQHCQIANNAQGCVRHGHMVNPGIFTNYIESQLSRSQNAPRQSNIGSPIPNEVPFDIVVTDQPVSLMKAHSRLANFESSNSACDTVQDGYQGYSCIRGMSIVTFVRPGTVDKDQDNQTTDEFRPPPWGDDKGVSVNTSTMDAWLSSNFPALDDPGFSAADAEALYAMTRIRDWGRGVRMWHIAGNQSGAQVVLGSDGAGNITRNCAYNSAAHVCRSTGILRILFADANPLQEIPRSVGRQAWINVLQYSLDLGRAATLRSFNPEVTNGGTNRGPKGWGGHHHGRLPPVSFCAAVLGHGECVTTSQDMSDGGRFQDTAWLTRRNGKPYLGHDQGGCQVAPTVAGGFLSNGNVNAFCVAGGQDELDVTCAGNRDYARVWQRAGTPYGLYFQIIPAMRGFWGDANISADTETWARAQSEGGRGPGHTQWNYCGPNNYANSGNETNNASTNNYRHVLADAMWDTYKNWQSTPQFSVQVSPTTYSGPSPITNVQPTVTYQNAVQPVETCMGCDGDEDGNLACTDAQWEVRDTGISSGHVFSSACPGITTDRTVRVRTQDAASARTNSIAVTIDVPAAVPTVSRFDLISPATGGVVYPNLQDGDSIRRALLGLRCVGGANDGNLCTSLADCTGGTSCDPIGFCVQAVMEQNGAQIDSLTWGGTDPASNPIRRADNSQPFVESNAPYGFVDAGCADGDPPETCVINCRFGMPIEGGVTQQNGSWTFTATGAGPSGTGPTFSRTFNVVPSNECAVAP